VSQRIASTTIEMISDPEIRVCVPLNEQTLRGLTLATATVPEAADMLELRLDGLEPSQIHSTTSELRDLVGGTSRPVILTFRPAEQGGYRSITATERQLFWDKQFDSEAAFFDLESDLVQALTIRDADAQPDWSRVICSHHDFAGVPDNLDELYERMAFSPARILKLAVTAKDAVDCLSVFNLLDRARTERREIIAIAMGEAGVMTRILGPSRGSFLTYGALEVDRGTAPGQVVASDLKSVYRIDQINRETMITALVGAPVSHSVSPHMHNAAFREAAINGVYLPLEVQNLAGFFGRMVNPRTREFNWNLRGLGITAPHKAEVMKYLDWIESRAQKIGAVNTVLLENEQLRGYNTDADGLIEPLIRRMGSIAGSHAAVIGAGGAASAAVFALQEQTVDVTLYARNTERAQAEFQRFNISCEPLRSASFAGKDVVINATPLGSLGVQVNETPAVADQLRDVRLVYDLVYNPIETRFLLEARKAGCQVLGGLEMLVAQAKLQFKLWTNTNASSELMYASGSSALTKTFSGG
jgi:3-dehydroquinate dehydratase/shikimate dehydrogenase